MPISAIVVAAPRISNIRFTSYQSRCKFAGNSFRNKPSTYVAHPSRYAEGTVLASCIVETRANVSMSVTKRSLTDISM